MRQSFITSIKDNQSLFTFGPMIILIIITFTLDSYYIFTECLPIESYSLKTGYQALIKHPFLISSFQYFFAVSVFIIAWHRSIATDNQIKLQRQSINTSNFYDLLAHCRSILCSEKSADHFSKNEKSSSLFFKMIFTDPFHGVYSPNYYLFILFEEINAELSSILGIKFEYTFHVSIGPRPELDYLIYELETSLGFFDASIPIENSSISEKIERLIYMLEVIGNVTTAIPISNKNSNDFSKKISTTLNTIRDLNRGIIEKLKSKSHDN